MTVESMNTNNTTHGPRRLPARLPGVCVAVGGSIVAEMLERAEVLVRNDSFLEFRLDYLGEPAAALDDFKQFTERHPEAVLLGTCRRTINGGRFCGSLAAEIEVLLKAAAAGFQLVDLELESAQELTTEDLVNIRSQAALLLSYHDFHETTKLDETFASMAAIPADYYKLVTTANSLYNNVVMLKFLEQQSQKHPVVGFCMGEQGTVSRLLALRAGSTFTFAAAFPGEETAPGQMAAPDLRDVYRVCELDAATRIYGVAGDPVAQSLSPQMLNAAFRRENINAVYVALHTKVLDDLLACVRDLPLSGLSVTMPHKGAILAHLDQTDALTQKTGACNTVARSPDGRLFGFNTDVAGVIIPLEQRLSLAGAKVLVIGAGGAARAAVFGLRDRDVNVFIVNRTATRGQELAKQAEATYLERADVEKHSFDAIINATPVGMEARQLPLDEKEIHARFVLDMVYTRPETPFTMAARRAGAQIIPGAEMFVHQGARQFEIWTGKPAPVQEMLNVVVSALAARSPAH